MFAKVSFRCSINSTVLYFIDVDENLIYMNVSKLFLASMGALASMSVSADDVPRKPNVVLIYADDLGYGDLSCYGAKNVVTPNVDTLAENGCRFVNAHSVASTSTPSRYSLLTGEYPWRKPGTDVAAGDAAMIISPEQYTVADMFKDAGYTTAAVGKWHLGLGDESGRQNWNEPLPVGLADIGFDYSYIMAATADRVPCVFVENGCVANYDASAPVFVSYEQNFEGEPTGRDNPECLYNLRHSHGHDMSIVNGIGRIGYMKGGGKALWKDENIADSITEHALDFIEKNIDRPFFLYFATNDVHVPRFPHERFRGKSGMGLRGDAIAQFDWCVGEVVRLLKEKGIFENTLLIVTSDNGAVADDGYLDDAEALLNGHDPVGGLRGGKYSCFEGGTRIPFIIHWPAIIKEASVRDCLLSQVDFMCAMSKVAGVSLPREASPDGDVNAADYWLGEGPHQRDYLVEMASNHTLSLRMNSWKYIEPGDGPAIVPWGPKIETGYNNKPQLYRVFDADKTSELCGSSSIPDDPCERNNLADDYPEQVKRMSQTLEIIRKQPMRCYSEG